MRRIYFTDFHPTDLAFEIATRCNLKHPKFKYANQQLKNEFNAKIKRENNGEIYYIEFDNDEDVVAFKLKYGF